MALSQIGNVGPDLGQSYIVDSFMVVVLGGVGQLAGTIIAAIGLGEINKFLEPFTGAVLGKIFRPDHHHSVYPETAPRDVRARRAHGGELSMDLGSPGSLDFTIGAAGFGWRLFAAVVLVVIPLLRLAVPPDSALHLSDYYVLLIGKIMCYAMMALAMDLIWGYAGILSLGHGLFFAFGGYSMGMYLMREIGNEGQYRSYLPDFMVFLDWKDVPVVLGRQRNIFSWRC